MSDPTWTDLLILCPALGDLLATVRAYRGDDPEGFFWAEGGVDDRARALTRALDWPDLSDSENVCGAVVALLWWALPIPQGGTMDVDAMTLDERYAAALRQMRDHGNAFWKLAERARSGEEIRINGEPVPAEFLDRFAAYAASYASEDDDAATAHLHAALVALKARMKGGTP